MLFLVPNFPKAGLFSRFYSALKLFKYVPFTILVLVSTSESFISICLFGGGINRWIAFDPKHISNKDENDPRKSNKSYLIQGSIVVAGLKVLYTQKLEK